MTEETEGRSGGRPRCAPPRPRPVRCLSFGGCLKRPDKAILYKVFSRCLWGRTVNSLTQSWAAAVAPGCQALSHSGNPKPLTHISIWIELDLLGPLLRLCPPCPNPRRLKTARLICDTRVQKPLWGLDPLADLCSECQRSELGVAAASLPRAGRCESLVPCSPGQGLRPWPPGSAGLVSRACRCSGSEPGCPGRASPGPPGGVILNSCDRLLCGSCQLKQASPSFPEEHFTCTPQHGPPGPRPGSPAPPAPHCHACSCG